jgi:hypothetical protein
MKNSIAPRPAPAEIPSSPASAKLFRNNDCNMMPEQLNAAPINSEFRTRGSLMSNIIFLIMSFSCALLKISDGRIKTLPIINDVMNDSISITKSIVSIFRFRFKLYYGLC